MLIDYQNPMKIMSGSNDILDGIVWDYFAHYHMLIHHPNSLCRFVYISIIFIKLILY
jgi:hypothetical protein